MQLQIAAVAIFVGVFVLATRRKVHIGVLMCAAAAGVGVWMADMSLDKVVAGFPIGILVLLVGVTYYFAIAQANGTIDLIVERAIAGVGPRAFFLPIAFFALTIGISAMGSPLAGLVMAPIGMRLRTHQPVRDPHLGLKPGHRHPVLRFRFCPHPVRSAVRQVGSLHCRRHLRGHRRSRGTTPHDQAPHPLGLSMVVVGPLVLVGALVFASSL